MLTIKETGVQYKTASKAVFTHASGRGQTLAYVKRPLTYEVTTTTTTNPFTQEVTTTEHKVYVDDITPVEIGDGVRVLRDLKFEETNFMVDRHREELELGLTPTLTPTEYTDLLTYRQELRDLPLQAGFPTTYTWPSNPLTGA